MQVVIRTYYGKGTKKLFDLLEHRQGEVQDLMRSIEGLVSYILARNGNGGFSVTVCQDKRGIKQSVKTARDFIAQHAPEMSLAAMQVSEGSVITHLNQLP
jgi:hypothetical protein